MALLEAAKNGNADQVKQLLAGGGSVGQIDGHGYTALHCASLNNHPAVVAILLAEGSPVDQAIDNGDTSLHFASLNVVGHMPFCAFATASNPKQ